MLAVIGAKLADRYEIVSELGRGGMGVVYMARDPLLNREVAMKLIAPSSLTPETEQRFQAEAQVVAQMDHPAIVPIHDFGDHEGSLFFVMPVVEGTSLRAHMREQSLSLGDVLTIGSDALDAPGYDLLALMTGSEGLLGIILEITVKLLPIPPLARVIMAAFDSVMSYAAAPWALSARTPDVSS